MWRPEGWDNNKRIVLYEGGRATGRTEIAINQASFEAGASDMRERLKAEGIKSPSYATIDMYNGKPGTWVFIPDEE